MTTKNCQILSITIFLACVVISVAQFFFVKDLFTMCILFLGLPIVGFAIMLCGAPRESVPVAILTFVGFMFAIAAIQDR